MRWSLAWCCVAAAFVLACGAVALGWPPSASGGDHPLIHAVTPVVLGLEAGLLIRAQRRNWMGVVLAGVAAVAGLWVVAEVLSVSGHNWALAISLWAWMPALLIPHSVLLLMFPDGALPSYGWRYAGWFTGLSVAATLAASAAYPAAIGSISGRAGNPLGIPLSSEKYASWVLFPLVCAAWGSVLIAVAALIWRWKRADLMGRRQLSWPVIGTLAALAVSFTPPDWRLLQLVPLIVPTSIIAAIKWRGLYQVDRILSRSVTYLAGTALILSLLVGTAALSGALVGRNTGLVPALIATAVLTLLFDPARRGLQSWIDRAVYGRRGDPRRAVERLGSRLTEMLTPEAVPQVIVEVVADSLGVHQVALLSLDDGRWRCLAVHGDRPEENAAHIVPLSSAEGPVGRLVIAVRDDGQPFNRADLHLIEALAKQAGSAVSAALLAGEVRRARTDLVLARDHERQRLRRDLHDGLGSYLTGIGFGIDGVRQQLPEAQAAQLAQISDQAAAAKREIRRILEGLHPGPLERLGLVEALNELVERSTRSAAFELDFRCPAELPPLSPEVELATFHIASEALTNTVRHSSARRCSLSLQLDAGNLLLVVEDDGIGVKQPSAGGVGIGSMRDRANALGGTVAFSEGREGGTVVSAHLPLVTSA